MFVYERMTKNVNTVEPEFSVSKAFQILTENKHSQLPVVDSEGKVIGLITEKLLAEVNPSKATSLSVYEINYLLSKTKVKDIMKTGIFKIHKDKLIEDAALIMKENRIGSLPVIDDDNYLVGIVTRVDIFSAFIEIMGVKDPGTRLTIKVKDEIGTIAAISSIIKDFNINIKHISNFSDDAHMELIIKLSTTDAGALVEELKNKGFEVMSVDVQR